MLRKPRAAVHEHVRQRDIPMQDAMLVSVMQSARNLDHQPSRSFWILIT